ncbi:MAG: hypothetical protein ACRD12_00080 [Acidimicrobiales bacterium]
MIVTVAVGAASAEAVTLADTLSAVKISEPVMFGWSVDLLMLLILLVLVACPVGAGPSAPSVWTVMPSDVKIWAGP